METIEKIILWAGTPWGKITVQGLSVFIFCEFAIRMQLLKGMKVFSKYSKLKREFIADYTGLVFNFIVGILVAIAIHYDHGFLHILFQSWYLIIISILAHIIYIRYLDKYIKKKYGID